MFYAFWTQTLPGQCGKYMTKSMYVYGCGVCVRYIACAVCLMREVGVNCVCDYRKLIGRSFEGINLRKDR